MKKILICALIMMISALARADEGMWLMYLLGDQQYNEMVKRGLKLSKEQLYNLNKASLKDAIVIFGGGCTGEIVSAQGLIFTNHHCGYSAIAAASTVEHNYLQNGFWAKNLREEIPSSGLSVQFLVRIDDVTKQVEEQLNSIPLNDRASKFQTISADIAKKAAENTGYEGRVVSFFKGNQYLLFVYERYKDVRLVGAPAESIGKFGGDTDNWEWPRHTGDFSVFRVYMNKDGKAADYSPDNVPYKPKFFLNVSTQGFADGDYAMVIGYPGGTNRYETSFGVKLKTDIENPAIVNLRDVRLKLMFNEMKKDAATRLKLASSYAGIANYWKFFDGERKQLLKHKVFEEKQTAEEKFAAWAKGKPEYEGLFNRYQSIYEKWTPYAAHRMYFNEGIFGSPLAAYAASLQALEKALTKKTVNADEVKKISENLNKTRQTFIESEDTRSDKNIVAATCKMFYMDIVPAQHPMEFYNGLRSAFGDLSSDDTYQKFADHIFANTFILNESKWNAFIVNPDSASLQNDPAYKYASAFIKNYNAKVLPYFTSFTAENNELGRLYLKGILEINSGKAMYPDANFTMRLSYGNVKSYKPRDAVFYDYVCTLSGVMEKYKPGDYEFDLPQSLITAYQNKDFGRYKDPRTGDIVVAFITTNDITGGNSGSPVLNGKGELIGLAFDGNYEALSHKISFDKNLNRTICVDVRYVLWCIDKLGGATNIIDELALK
jgi:hypothetical protein